MQARADVLAPCPTLLEAFRKPDIIARGERSDNAIRSQMSGVGEK
jgi:hypothetical protein